MMPAVRAPRMLWAVYERPANYPNGYLARRFEVTASGTVPTAHVVVGRTLAEVRARLPRGLVRMARRLFAGPLIETWV